MTHVGKEILNRITYGAYLALMKDGKCTWCKNPHVPFRDKLSEEESTISGFCQKCQDETFREAKEIEE